MPARSVPRLRPFAAMAGGMFLVLVAVFVLLVGFVVLAKYKYNLSSTVETLLITAICIFSAVSLLAGLPLIYRGVRADD